MGLVSWSLGHFFLTLVLCKPILRLLTEHHAPRSGLSEQNCSAGFQGVDFAALRGLWAELSLLSFSSP